MHNKEENVSIVKRDKRTRDAERCAGCYTGVGHPHAWACLQLQCLFYSRTGRTHRIVLTIVYTVTQPIENWNSKLRMIRCVKMRANPASVRKNPRHIKKRPYGPATRHSPRRRKKRNSRDMNVKGTCHLKQMYCKYDVCSIGEHWRDHRPKEKCESIWRMPRSWVPLAASPFAPPVFVGGPLLKL
jgi:hypothetical protein